VAGTGLTRSAFETLGNAGAYLSEFITPTVRLGVTGLARAGKTVFITALVRNLIDSGRMPFFGPAAEGRLARAYLEPQPDDALPRFAYEEHLAALAADPPAWPESTRRISQLRVTIEYYPKVLLKRALGLNRLHVDIIDYPGEWLLDLAMMDLDYRAWSNAALAIARDARNAAAARPWLDYLDRMDADAERDEQSALAGSAFFAAYLRAARGNGSAQTSLGPGRFLLPGDLEGSPLLTFFPLPLKKDAPIRRGTLAAMMERRYQSYKTHVVLPFFQDHFSRIERQIVLVDALAALNGGERGLADIERTLAAVLAPFRAGSSRWLLSLLTRRIDRILLAASKADHVHHSSHGRLEALLAQATRRAASRAGAAGAETRFIALSALRATREADVKRGEERLSCVVGTPLAGESLAGETFDGVRQAAIFPGDLAIAHQFGPIATGSVTVSQEAHFVRFRPPPIARDTPTGEPAPWPHIRMDRALDFLLGDRLA
jgi:predicted YcjX-like family ATPase